MNNQPFNNQPPQKFPFHITQDEIDVINELRKLNFGRILINVQNGVIVSMEITQIKKNQKRNNNNQKQN